MNKIQVSIICTNYNKGDWIAEAIESFLSQKTNFTFEILLIDDKSTDHSVDIIKKYAKKYPEKIRAFYNNKNLGITKTWIKICKKAKGKYIARCDGDDYWIDDYKLQKQVDKLESVRDSKWSSTDCSIISPDGEMLHKSAFESGILQRSSSYAEMLATKGFTMSSTWLVETGLMNEINANINNTSVDDTFNIQLDLFQKTQLTYIPEATVAYRMNEGSDSRPIDFDKIKLRNEQLLKTQLEYKEKYKGYNYDEIIDRLLRKSMDDELLAVERLIIIREQQRRIAELDSRVTGLSQTAFYRLKRLLLAPLVALKKNLKNTKEF